MNTSPAPWRIVPNHSAGGVVHLAILAENGDMPCSITPMSKLRTVDEANAQLIASAPDLLAQRNALRNELLLLADAYDRLLTAYGKPFEWGSVLTESARGLVAKTGGTP